MASNRNFDMIFGAVEQSDGSYIDRDGTITWYTEAGKYHNEDGPAIAFPSGGIRWYATGQFGWYLNGIHLSLSEWLIESNKTDEEKMLLRLQYG
jgi:hypothetical protein|tara:strand:+ start:199 stop:480 length:282 start_codon:yes stop_codon:yes gene_type:complete